MRWKQVELQKESETVKKVQKELQVRKKMQRRRRRRRRLIRIFLIAILFAFAFAFYRYDQSDLSRYQYLHVRGQKYLGEEEILKDAKIKKKDRVYLHFPRQIKNRVEKNPFVKTAEVRLKPFSQTAFISIEEKQALAYDDHKIYFEQGLSRALPKDLSVLETLPYLHEIKDEKVMKHLFVQLPKINDASLLAISEIEHQPDDLDEMFLKLTMNDGYYVFTSIETLPLLNNYATIISGVDPENRCIHILEYGPTEDTHVATAKPCE